MNCESYITLLDEYLNNELEEKLYSSVSAHLDKCEICREEIRLLRFESGLYQKIGNLREKNFTNQWDAMRARLVSESLIENNITTKPEEVENLSLFSLFSTFFIRLENLFLTKKPVFGILLLVILGVVTVFILSNRQNGVGEIATTKTGEVPKPEITVDKRENNVSLPDKAAASNDPQVIKKTVQTPPEKTVRVSSANLFREKIIVSGVETKFEKAKSRIKSPKNKSSVDSDLIASRSPVENIGNDLKPSPDGKNMANYLNKVHLFLLMFRNLENDEALNTIIGDKYQTEARMFLDNNNRYIETSLRNKNIPAAELLKEIEPVLEAISNLNEKDGKNEIGNVTAMVKQTGIVFKMRLWMSHNKSDRGEQS